VLGFVADTPTITMSRLKALITVRDCQGQQRTRGLVQQGPDLLGQLGTAGEGRVQPGGISHHREGQHNSSWAGGAACQHKEQQQQQQTRGLCSRGLGMCCFPSAVLQCHKLQAATLALVVGSWSMYREGSNQPCLHCSLHTSRMMPAQHTAVTT
jgi:hypothetical protein